MVLLAGFKEDSLLHVNSDLRAFLQCCANRELDSLAAARPQLELYVRWMQEVRRFKPSTVSRLMSVVTGFHRTCLIDGLLEHSPAEFVRRPHVPPKSPTLGLTHLQLRVRGKGGKVVLVPLPPAVARAVDRTVATRTAGPLLRNTRGRRMDRHAATRRLRRLADGSGLRLPRMHPHMLRHTFVTTMLDAGVDLRDVQIAARHADPRITMRYDRARNNLDRHPNYILAAYMASGT